MEKYSIKTGLREQTILKDVFFTPPFNVVEVRENKKNPLLEVMVMSSSPGLLHKDSYHINIEVIDNSCLNLQTQSYQRIYTSKHQTQQHMEVNIGDRAYFSHVPHPVVPHKNSNYKAQNTIRLTSSSTLLWSEILTCGRKLMEDEEVFSFKKHHSTTSIFVDEQLIFQDNVYLVPEEINIRDFGQYEHYTHQGSLFFIAPEIVIEDRINTIYDRLRSINDIDFGITKVRDNAYVLRALSHGGEKLYQLFTQIRLEEDALINTSKNALCKQN